MGTQNKRKRKNRNRRRKNKRRRHRRGDGLPVVLAGRTFYITPPKVDAIRELEEWIRSNRRSPLDIAKEKLDGLTEDQQRVLLSEALAQESRIADAVSDADFAAAIDSREGAARMLLLMIRKHHPDVTLAEIIEIMDQATEDEFDAFLAERDRLVDEADDGES